MKILVLDYHVDLRALDEWDVTDGSRTVVGFDDCWGFYFRRRGLDELLLGNPDIVVVGDYTRVGEEVVAALPTELLPRTIVVDDSKMRPADEEPYRNIGVTHFGRIRELPVLIRAMIAEISSPTIWADADWIGLSAIEHVSPEERARVIVFSDEPLCPEVEKAFRDLGVRVFKLLRELSPTDRKMMEAIRRRKRG